MAQRQKYNLLLYRLQDSRAGSTLLCTSRDLRVRPPLLAIAVPLTSQSPAALEAGSYLPSGG